MKHLKQEKTIYAAWVDTPLGPMVALGDERYLHFLRFSKRQNLENEIESLRSEKKVNIFPGKTKPLLSIEKELKSYFEGTLHTFKTPLFLDGTPFQKNAWEALLAIPYGQTRSYLEQAAFVGNPHAYRAVANANGSNQIVIVLPCHRIINHNGKLGGYGEGLDRKKWLLEHEKNYAAKGK